MSGKQRVSLYEGNIPKSGKTHIEFRGIHLAHLSKVSDKSDILVHIATGARIFAYPIKTSRGDVLDSIAKHIDVLERYDKTPESYELYPLNESIEKNKEEHTDKVYDIEMTEYSDGSCVRPRQNKKKVLRRFSISGKIIKG